MTASSSSEFAKSIREHTSATVSVTAVTAVVLEFEFSVCEDCEVLYLALDRVKGCFPFVDDLVHFRRWRCEVVVVGVVVEDCVGGCEHCVLDFDLRCEEAREEGEGC